MTEPDPRTHRNRLLAGLPESQMGHIAPHLEPVELPFGTVIEAPGELVEQVFFPASGLGSVVAVGPDGQSAEAGLFGRDGMTGLPVVMGDDRSPHETRVQLAGTGHHVVAGALREAMAEGPAVRERFLHFVQFFAAQTSHTALANARHTIGEPLARWLPMCHDRVEGEVLDLTHEFLSLMQGVRASRWPPTSSRGGA